MDVFRHTTCFVGKALGDFLTVPGAFCARHGRRRSFNRHLLENDVIIWIFNRNIIMKPEVAPQLISLDFDLSSFTLCDTVMVQP